MKILVVLANPWEVRLFADSLSARPEVRPADITLFSSDARTRQELKKLGYACSSESDYDFPESRRGVTERAYFLSENWWKNFYSLIPSLDADGINIPALLERDAVYFFLWVLRTVAFTQELFKQTAPAEVWAGVPSGLPELFLRSGREESLHGRIALDLAQTHGINTRIFRAPIHVKACGFTLFLFRKITLLFAGVRLRAEMSRSDFRPLPVISAMFRDLASAIFQTFSSQGRPADTAKPCVLISSSESHIAPVLSELRERGLFRFAFIRETFSPGQISAMEKQREGFHAISMGYRGARGNISQFWNANQDAVLADPQFVWRGYAFGPLLKHKFRFLFETLFPSLIQFRDQIAGILKLENPSVILAEEDACVFNKTLLRVASGLKIPSLVVQHGFSVLRVGFYPLSATRFAAYGDAARRRLAEWGVESGRVVLTGNVLHDKITDGKIPSREAFFGELGLDPSSKTVLLGMFPYRDYSAADFPEVESGSANYFRLIETTARAIESLSGVQLIVKLHPRDSKLRECSDFLKKFPKVRAVAVQKGPSVHYSAHCDVLVTVLSTLLIDTLPFKKPMIVVDFSGNRPEETRNMISMDIPVIAGDSSLLEESIQRSITHANTAVLDSIAADHLYRLDGKAASRAADALCSLVPNLVTGDCHVSA